MASGNGKGIARRGSRKRSVKLLFTALHEFIRSSLSFCLACRCEISLIGRQQMSWSPWQIKSAGIVVSIKITNVSLFSANCRTAEENTLLTTIKCYTFAWRVATYRHIFRPDLTNRTKHYYMVNLNRTTGFDYFDHRTNCVREFVNISIFEVIEHNRKYIHLLYGKIVLR